MNQPQKRITYTARYKLKGDPIIRCTEAFESKAELERFLRSLDTHGYFIRGRVERVVKHPKDTPQNLQ